MSKVAVIDIDNTLWQFCDAFYEELKKINSTFPSPDRWTSFEVWEGYCAKEDFLNAINAIHFRQDSDTYIPYPEARNFLSTLREMGFHLIVASHRLPETRNQTERWLARHNLPYDVLHLSFDKTVLFGHARVVVDDAPQTLEKAVEHGALSAGLSFPWNRAYAGNGFRLFRNLDEVLNYIISFGPRV
jgi:FMN phosphatase YigB (HAD superfamily)